MVMVTVSPTSVFPTTPVLHKASPKLRVGRSSPGSSPHLQISQGCWDRGAVSPADTDRQTAGRLAAWEMVRNQLQKLSGCQDFTPRAIFKC